MERILLDPVRSDRARIQDLTTDKVNEIVNKVNELDKKFREIKRTLADMERRFQT